MTAFNFTGATPSLAMPRATFDAAVEQLVADLPALTEWVGNTSDVVEASQAQVLAMYADLLSQSAVANAKATSTTSLTVGTGPVTLATQAGKSFVPGQAVIISSQSNRARWMWGVVSSYVSTSLEVEVSQIGAAGTATDWDILIAQPQTRVTVTDFTTPGTHTWTKSPTARAVLMIAVGGGGGGGGAPATNVGATGGGGGGAYAERWLLASQLESSNPVVVAVGGSPGTGTLPAGGGGTSSVGFSGQYIKAGGGGPAAAPNSSTGCTGGGGGGGWEMGGGAAAAPSGGSAGFGGGDGGRQILGGLDPTGALGNTAATHNETRPYAGGPGGGGSDATGSVVGHGGHAIWGGGGGGGGGTATGGNGGNSMFGGLGGGGGGTTPGASGTKTTFSPIIGSAGNGALNANGENGGVGSGGGGVRRTSGGPYTGGAGGRGHVRIIEIG